MVIRFKRFDYLVTLACLALLGYFAWHAAYGARSYKFHDVLQVNANFLEKQLGNIMSQRKTIEAQVSLVRPENIDPDMLDELARRDLDLVKSTDLVVHYSN
jgi:cell division protein FtsB